MKLNEVSLGQKLMVCSVLIWQKKIYQDIIFKPSKGYNTAISLLGFVQVNALIVLNNLD